ncbi:MAG: hypothetical protein NTZ56_23545 [Acidobacteria bacterium]|nr:hypothetical protein [Acidobacteriota bacterium]
MTNFNRVILHAAGIPKVTAFIGDVRSTMIKYVTDAVVCIDDLERRGEKLAIRDVMGLVSQLKEDRRCKIAIILNADALNSDDRKGFDHYFEKVIDARLPFDPSPAKAVEIALPEAEVDGQLSDCCRQLGIKNIRVIRKIRASCVRLRTILESFDPRVHENAIRTVSVLGWIVYDRDSAPSVDFIRSKVSPVERRLLEKELSPEEEKWDQLLNSCNFTYMDEFDRAVLDWLLSGHLDAEPILQTASKVGNRLEQQYANELFEQAWSLYHDSFDDNAQELGAAMLNAFIGTIKYRTPNDLSGVVRVLKVIGWEDEAASLIREYRDRRPDAIKEFRRSVFAQSINDSDVLSMLRDPLEPVAEGFDAAATLSAIAKSSGYSNDSLTRLAELPSDEYYRIFRPATDEAQACIRAALRIIGSPTGQAGQQQIYQSARAALVRIGRESLLNKDRIERIYGIDIDADSAAQ